MKQKTLLDFSISRVDNLIIYFDVKESVQMTLKDYGNAI